MELPSRPSDDILLKPGALTDLRQRLRALTQQRDISAVIACAFDHRTRMLPFFLADTHMIPAGPRAVAAALIDSGITNIRLVLQQWNKHFDPAKMRLDGKIPDLFCLSSMSLHTAEARKLLRRVAMIPPKKRPLVLAGGSVCVYEPWELFDASDEAAFGPDVCITGETFPFLSMMEILLTEQGENESLREAFLRCKSKGFFDATPGIMYPQGEPEKRPEMLIDTGIQRLCGNLDEMAFPVSAFSVLELPSRSATLGSKPLPADLVRKFSPLTSMTWTFGCKFKCEYCPIPAYNQKQYRTKSPQRMIDELTQLYQTYGLRNYFGADDNFFNDHQRALDCCEQIAEATIDGKPLRKFVRLATEVTVHDTFALRDNLQHPIRKASFRAFWLGVEDMSGALVKKGQTADRTLEAFDLLLKNGIIPNPMMMHHDNQPLMSWKDHRGLLNQVHLLAQSGAATLQVLMITPSAGSKLYEGTFNSGMVIDQAGPRKTEASMFDGNYVIASNAPKIWKKQLNLLLAYVVFYNPVRLLAIICSFRKIRRRDARIFGQLWGMWGLTQNIRRTIGWAFRLMLGKVKKKTSPPESPFPVLTPDGQKAPHVNGQPDELHRPPS